MRGLGCLALPILLCAPARADDFEKQRRIYLDYVNRPSFEMRTRGRDRLAATGDPRALQILAASYGKPKDPKDQEQYLIASICWDRLNEAIHVPIYDQWRKKHSRAKDAWLWFRALDVRMIHHGTEEMKRVATGNDNIFLRAAAVHTLGIFHEPDILGFIPGFVENMREQGLDRSLLLEACAAGLLRQLTHLGQDDFRAAALKIMRQLDLKETPERTKMVIARHLARLFKTDRVITNSSRPWRNLLLADEARKAAQHRDHRYAGPKRPTFVGIEATGTRICYLIDSSDSMLTPLTAREKNLVKGPITGKRFKPKDQKKDDLPGEKDLNWRKIKNRFDAAREYLKLSLRGLDEQKHFAVIFFGSKASFLRASRGLVKATRNNIEAACRELDSMRAGPKGQNRPHGTLHGNTNMHGGLHRAFKLKGKTMVRRYEYVDPATFKGGCDTIFVLSDGDPSADDWPQQDRRDRYDRAGDPELGGRAASTPDTLLFQGPYSRNRNLTEDVRRLNLFRNIEIHCVGLGEANQGLLQSLSRIGLGKTKMVGESIGSTPAKQKK